MLYVLALVGLAWFVYAAVFTSFFTPAAVALCFFGTCLVVAQVIMLMPTDDV